jgi:hypothetical protein
MPLVVREPRPTKCVASTPLSYLTSSARTRKGIAMGKQSNKVEKRRRRRDYLQRKKNAAKAAKR